MPVLKLPTPLRQYADGQEEIALKGNNVGEVLDNLVEKHPSLRQHLFNESDELRPFVNLFINEEDIRYLDGLNTDVDETDRLMIIPSIAGGSEGLEKVDHAALKTNQAFIIGLSLVAFIFNFAWLALLVGIVMAAGTVLKVPGFGMFYKRILNPLGLVRADILIDNPEPHRFAQGFGAVVLLLGSIALFTGVSQVGWGLVWLVIALAALNLFGGFCAGCAVYYWLSRLNVPGFEKSPPGDTFPGMRPKVKA